MKSFWRLTYDCFEVVHVSLILCLLVLPTVLSCGPGRRSGLRRRPKSLIPLVFKQYVPNISEKTIGASSKFEGRITREDPRFRQLVPNYNDDIIFRDEEGTGADRLMTKRCREKLNTLAVSVMNQWPGVRLRVTEGWDEDGHHSPDSLHYEGRAVDVSTSDRDRSKYGMLARLAVEAGFDWVYYESRSHVHCSVKSDSAQSVKYNGCFSSDSVVHAKSGDKLMSQVEVGEELLAIDPEGKLLFSEVILLLDSSRNETRSFVNIETRSNLTVSLTPSHLIYMCPSEYPNCTSQLVVNRTEELQATFAKYVLVGDSVAVEVDGKFVLEEVTRTWITVYRGYYAPLTRQGTILVNRIASSCYAVIEDHWLAHLAFFPVRWFASLQNIFGSLLARTDKGRKTRPNGIHWYPYFLYRLASAVMPADIVFD